MENKVHQKWKCFCFVKVWMTCTHLDISPAQLVVQHLPESGECSGLYLPLSPLLMNKKEVLPQRYTAETLQPDGDKESHLWGGLTLSSMLWDLLRSCSFEMWPQYLQRLFTQILGMERMSRMPRVWDRVCHREASHRFATKNRGRCISSAKDWQG